MAEREAPGFQFECDLCGEECLGIPKIIDKQHQYIVDEDCAAESIVPLLLAAQANEYSHPPRWGNVIIDYRRFKHLLPKGFTTKYTQKRHEYRTPLAQRNYCRNQRRKELDGLEEQCGAFLGVKVNVSFGDQVDDTLLRRCHVCGARCCKNCGRTIAVDGTRQITRHRCATPTNDDSAFDGLIKGIHYQICPGCGMKVELAEACNALKCLGHACRTSFCAICGLRADHDSTHWQAGKPCPRWNKPTDANAGFDAAPVVVEPPSAEWLLAQRLVTEEMESWRKREYNHVLVTDEKHTVWWLHVSELTAKYIGQEQRPERALRELNSQLEGLLERGFRETGIPDAGFVPAQDRVYALWEGLVDKETGLANEANLTCFRSLLLLHQDALQVLPVHRGVGRRLTKQHLTELQTSYVCKYFGIGMLGEAIEDHFLLAYPRLIDMFQRTLEELEWLMFDIREELIQPTAEIEARNGTVPAEENNTNQLCVPAADGRPSFWTASYEVYKGLEAKRLDMIELGMARPPRLGAAIDMFWLQYSTSKILRRFQKAQSTREKHYWMVNFMAQDQEIRQRREEMGTEMWPAEFKNPDAETWEATMDEYNEFAKRFKKLVPATILIDFQRGWLD